jgi:hypothetical protein
LAPNFGVKEKKLVNKKACLLKTSKLFEYFKNSNKYRFGTQPFSQQHFFRT